MQTKDMKKRKKKKITTLGRCANARSLDSCCTLKAMPVSLLIAVAKFIVTQQPNEITISSMDKETSERNTETQ